MNSKKWFEYFNTLEKLEKELEELKTELAEHKTVYYLGLKSFFLKLEYGMGGYDNYIGYWLIFAENFESAKKKLIETKVEKQVSWGYIRVTKVNPTEMLEHFSEDKYELGWDCYN